ncbi:MAG: hypothetical protein Q9169_001082 [Polycauliona sp. 2 TL-2023]
MPPNFVAAQDFAKPSLPRHSNNGSKRSRASSVHSPSVRLSIIEEDAAAAPPMPPQAHHRPFHRRWNLGDPPRSSFESPPPKYSVWDTKGPKGEKLSEVRNNKHIARRGGWRRICLILLILLTIVVALAVGLSIGLRKKESDTPSEPVDSPSTSPPAAAFPVGSYTLTTYLSTVRTSCVSQPADWSCFPYHTYSQSPSEALANFTWVITSSSPSSFAISSTSNPWSVEFPSTPLQKVNPDTEEEHYHFTTSFDKTTVPSAGVQCQFNDTLLEGNLYTKKARNYPSPSPAEPPSASSTDKFQPWPYAIDIQQTIGGGQDSPQCFRMQSGRLGDRIINGRTPKGENEECSCEYKNFES